MSSATPVLDLAGAQPLPFTTRLPPVPLDLQLMPGQCVLIEARDPIQAGEFADLCCGLRPLLRGNVRFLGRDWADTQDERAAAMRGRIGRTFGSASWISYLGADENILLSQLHHTHRPEPMLRDAAAELSRSFGLPGLPLALPGALSAIDLARAACVRAFMGEPLLLMLESPVQDQLPELVPPLLNALAAAHDRQAASIWLTRGDFVWADRSFPATVRLRLVDRGLVPVREMA